LLLFSAMSPYQITCLLPKLTASATRPLRILKTWITGKNPWITILQRRFPAFTRESQNST
jgi:hypothetical protein